MSRPHARRHFIIPDTQVKPGVPTDHLLWVGAAIAEYEPDVLICLGDWADMESLSSYKSRREAEGKRYAEDIASARNAMVRLFDALNDACRTRAKRAWLKGLRKVLTLGNHEYRIQRAVNEAPNLEGFMSMGDLRYEDFGWEVYPFLDLVEIDGVTYSHYFQNSMGRPYAGMIETRIRNIGFSFVQGHQQGKRQGEVPRNNGDLHRGLSVGSCYMHDEDYMAQANAGHWRGVVVLNDVRRGNYDLMELSLDYLCRRFGPGQHVWQFMKRRYPAIYRGSSWLRQEERMRA